MFNLKQDEEPDLTERIMEIVLEKHKPSNRVSKHDLLDIMHSLLACLDYMIFLVGQNEPEDAASLAAQCINWFIRTETEVTGCSREEIELSLRKMTDD